MKILFFLEGRFSPSSRFRVLQYLPYLKEHNISYEIQYFRDENFPYGMGLTGLSSYFISARDIMRRLIKVLSSSKFDIIFLQRELLPWNTYLLEKILSRINKNIIFDFDDAIYMSADGSRSYAEKIIRILRYAKRATVANQTLANFSRRFADTDIIPMAVDTEKILPVSDRIKEEKIQIGWIGTPTNFEFLRSLTNPLQNILKKKDAELVLISARPEASIIKNLNAKFKSWSEDTELELLSKLDIGIVPLSETLQAKSKFPIKLLLFMALGIPVVCSRWGVPAEIILDGINGFLAKTDAEWKDKLRLLVDDYALRERIGREARKTVEEKFSMRKIFPSFLSVLKEVGNG